ncbi:hypothetical protein SDC9_139910 [bioreactor metagenome]|uniref:Uncharacterized protein n=1 Tax=bioreactor metagenome TaxID=1076179 RepID=A0A645DTE8_9ZZZZ
MRGIGGEKYRERHAREIVGDHLRILPPAVIQRERITDVSLADHKRGKARIPRIQQGGDE